MLLGYKKETGEIEFLFSDTEYLKKRFPNNTAKISDFWKKIDHKLTEFFIDDFSDFNHYRHYKIIDGKIAKKTDEELKAATKIKDAKSKLFNLDAKTISLIIPGRKSFSQLK